MNDNSLLKLPFVDVINQRNFVQDYDYYNFKDLQSAVVLKLTAELKVSFPACRKVFSKVTTQTSLKLLDVYQLAEVPLAASKETVVEIIRSTARCSGQAPPEHFVSFAL